MDISSCCKEILEIQEYDEDNENAPQNFDLHVCPKCKKLCESEWVDEAELF